jgi:hypothetical protein
MKKYSVSSLLIHLAMLLLALTWLYPYYLDGPLFIQTDGEYL